MHIYLSFQWWGSEARHCLIILVIDNGHCGLRMILIFDPKPFDFDIMVIYYCVSVDVILSGKMDL